MLTRDPARPAACRPASPPPAGTAAPPMVGAPRRRGRDRHLPGENIGAGRWTAEREAAHPRQPRALGRGRPGGDPPAAPRPPVLCRPPRIGYYGPRGDDGGRERAAATTPARVCATGGRDRRTDALGCGGRSSAAASSCARGGALPRCSPLKLFAGGRWGVGASRSPDPPRRRRSGRSATSSSAAARARPLQPDAP